MKIQFPYAAKEPDELNLAVGDVVVIIDTDEEPGWFRGVHRGKVGVLPSNVILSLFIIYCNNHVYYSLELWKSRDQLDQEIMLPM